MGSFKSLQNTTSFTLQCRRLITPSRCIGEPGTSRPATRMFLSSLAAIFFPSFMNPNVVLATMVDHVTCCIALCGLWWLDLMDLLLSIHTNSSFSPHLQWFRKAFPSGGQSSHSKTVSPALLQWFPKQFILFPIISFSARNQVRILWCLQNQIRSHLSKPFLHDQAPRKTHFQWHKL